jgi:hypothetical protein
MHGLKPDDIKHLSPLRGDVLTLVGVEEYQLDFGFNQQGSLSVQGRCELLEDSGAIIDVWDTGARSEGFRFLELLGKTVTTVVIDSSKSFTLTFSDGRCLRIIDNSDQYESFSFNGLYV